jgi:hypothetical protein
MQCILCDNTKLKHFHNKNESGTSYIKTAVCFNCYHNNYLISYTIEKSKDKFADLNIMKLTKNTNSNKKVKDLNYLCRNAFRINKNIYVATDIYSFYNCEPKSIYIVKNLPVDVDKSSSYMQYHYDIDIIFLKQIKSCKNPEDAVDTINTLLTFN